MQVKEIFNRFKGGITLALSLVLIEKVAWIIEPTVLGDVIDAMIGAHGFPAFGPALFPVLLWVFIFSLNSGVGAYRRSRSEKIFLNIYCELATSIAVNTRDQKLSPSKATARAELSREYISFFQYRIPEIIEQGIDIFGTIIALSLFDWRLSVVCLCMVVPLTFISYFYSKKISVCQKHFHDSREDAYNIFVTQDPEKVRQYCNRMAQWQQRIANWGAFNFGVVRIFLLGIFLVILYIAIGFDNFSTGNIYSITAYVWTFVTSSEYLPEQLESWTSIRDISSRLRVENV